MDDLEGTVPEDVTSSSDTPADDTTSIPSEDVTSEPPSSGGDGPPEPESIFDAITAEFSSSPAAEPRTPEDAASDPNRDPNAAAQPADPEPNAEPEGDLPPDPDEAELKNYTPRTRRRIERLLAERKEARQEAERARPLLQFMQQNDIPAQDVDTMMGMAAQLRKGDFNGFLRTIDPYIKLAQQYTGQRLAPDLQKQVKDGFISPQAARELSARRSQAELAKRQAQQQQARMQQQVQVATSQAITSAISQWEKDVRGKDPDYGAKADIVRRTAQALIQENGPPKSPQQALQYANRAYEEANKVVERIRPRPSATPAAPSSVNQSARTPRPEPENMLQAIQQAVGG